MLYSIIPPILIVASLVGIIIFLVKKAPKIALLEKMEIENNKGENSKKSFFGKFKKKNREDDGIDFKHRLLLLLEKITRKLKLLFLKLENLFTVWSEMIKQKRRMRESRGKFSDLISKKEGRIVDNEGEKDNQEKKSLMENKNDAVEKEDEKIIEKKDILEKILIERIAANPKDVEAYERLGEYYFEIENWNYAKECFKQVIKLNPNNMNIKAKMRKLGRLLSR